MLRPSIMWKEDVVQCDDLVQGEGCHWGAVSVTGTLLGYQEPML